MEREIIEKLRKKNLTLSTCESCTSGLLCSTLTNIEHSSEVIIGGYITYTNEQKIRVGVSKQIIEKFGVYSLECAKEMARICKINSKSKIGIGVTGTLGNLDPNNNDSKLGKIYYAIVMDIPNSNYVFTKEFEIILDNDDLSLDRYQQKKKVVQIILSNLNKLLKE